MRVENKFSFPITMTMFDPETTFGDDIWIRPGQKWSDLGSDNVELVFGPDGHVIDPVDATKSSQLFVINEMEERGVIVSYYRAQDPRVTAWRNDAQFV